MRHFLSLIVTSSLILFMTSGLNAQEECENLTLPTEEVSLHLDRNIALTGETIWFKAYCFVDGKLEEQLSKILYLEIFDESGKIVFQEKYKISKNVSSGSIQIPVDATSKYYYLKAYTKYMRNFSTASFHYQQITIVNPDLKGGIVEARKSAELENTNKTSLKNKKEINKINLSLSKTKFQSREKILVQVAAVGDWKANLSASVRLEGLGNRLTPETAQKNNWLLKSCFDDPFCSETLIDVTQLDSDFLFKKNESLTKNVKQLEWLPETKGLSISGVIQNAENEGVEEVLSTLSFVQKEPMLYMSKTNEDGEYIFVLHDAIGPKNLFIGSSDANHKVRIRSNFEIENPTITSLPLQYDSSIHSLLESLHLYQQVKSTYPDNVSKEVYEIPYVYDSLSNIVKPDRRVVLDEYVDIPTLKEILREVIPGIQVQKVEGKESLIIFNLDQERYYKNPLILIDNVPAYNIDEVLKMQPSQIEAVEVYQSNYILGDYKIGGIISIISKTDNFASYEWGESIAFTAFKGLYENVAFQQVLHEEESHYPDFTPVVYWQPDFEIGATESKKDLEFFAPDLPGKYEILVQGFTNAGTPCIGYIKFEVENGFNNGTSSNSERE